MHANINKIHKLLAIHRRCCSFFGCTSEPPHTQGRMNSDAYASILRKCANSRALSEGKRVHSEIVRCGYEHDRFLANLLVQMYGNCGRIEDARMVFDKIQHRNAFSYNLMVAAYIQSGKLEDARSLFDVMPEKTAVSWSAMITAYAQKRYLKQARFLFDKADLRNVVTWTTMFMAYAQNADLQDAKSLFDKMPERDIISWNIMLAAFTQNGHLQEARNLLEEMPDRNMVSWTALISAYAQKGEGDMAIEIFGLMDLEGVQPDSVSFLSVLDACASVGALPMGKAVHPDVIEYGLESDVLVGTALFNMYGKCGGLQNARSLFEQVLVRDVVAWNAMVAAYARNGHTTETIELFRIMVLEGMQPTATTFMNILSVCGHTGWMANGYRYFASMSDDFGIIPTAELYICLLDVLGRSGQLEETEDLINNMPFEPDVVAWRTFLGACKVHSNVERGARAAKQIHGLDPEGYGPYVMLSNICAANDNPGDVSELRQAMNRVLSKPVAAHRTDITIH